MHFAHHNRQERREQQRDVSEIICSRFLQASTGMISSIFFLYKQGGLALFFQLMPILILIIVSALSQLMVTQPPYSLSYHP